MCWLLQGQNHQSSKELNFCLKARFSMPDSRSSQPREVSRDLCITRPCQSVLPWSAPWRTDSLGKQEKRMATEPQQSDAICLHSHRNCAVLHKGRGEPPPSTHNQMNSHSGRSQAPLNIRHLEMGLSKTNFVSPRTCTFSNLRSKFASKQINSFHNSFPVSIQLPEGWSLGTESAKHHGIFFWGKKKLIIEIGCLGPFESLFTKV